MPTPKYEDILLSVQSVVSTSKDYVPLTGVYSVEEEIKGWQWDKRRIEDKDLSSTRYNTYIGGHAAGLKDGTQLNHWQSGAIDGLQFLSIVEHPVSDSLTWTPLVECGHYSTYWNERRLFSDHSISQRIDPLLNSNGVMVHELRSDCMLSSIEVALFHRDANMIRRAYHKLNYVDEFTGSLDTNGNSRLSTTDDDGNVLWSSLSDRKYEYTLVKKDGIDYIYTNQDLTIDNGFAGEINAETADKFLENKDQGNPEGRDVYLNFFPVVNDSVEMYAINSSGVVTKLKEVATLNFSEPSEQAYSVDYDLGIVRLGGYQAPDLYLKLGLDPETTEVECYIDDDVFASYPNQGILVIENEYILYYGKSRNRFYDCVRGYNNTVAAIHNAGTIVSDIQHGQGTKSSQTIYASYTATPRVEYEVLSDCSRTANKTGFLDIKAISNVETNNVIQISPVEAHLSEITLAVGPEVGSIGGELYGPIRYGTDTARLIATAYDSMGNSVEDIELTIVLESNVGSLNSTLSQYTALSNSAGQIYALYNAPYDWASVLKDVYSVTHSSGDTIFDMDETIPPGITAKDIVVYQVLKHDKILGTKGTEFPVTIGENDPQYDNSITVIGRSSITIDGYIRDVDSTYIGGTAHIVCDDGITHTREIVGAFANVGSNTQTLIFSSTVNSFDSINFPTGSSTNFNNARCWLIERGAQEFNTDFLDGARVILYEWNTDVEHPIYGRSPHPQYVDSSGVSVTGAYFPVRPTEVSSTRLVFAGRTLPLPNATDRDNNLGGYMVVTSDMVSLYAYGKDPVSGRLIRSNSLRLRLDLPPHLKGVDSDGALPIPYGFRFATESHNIGAGIGGSNFLTINPKAEGINTFNVQFDMD